MYVFPRYALIIGLTLVYFLAGRAGLHFFGLVHPSASAIWIPTGIAIASLLTFGYRVWPAIFAGAFLVNLTTQGSLITSLGVAAGNTLEGIVVAWLVGRFAGGSAVFAHASNLFRFAGVALLAGATISATVGVMSLTLGGYAPAADFGDIWFTWWLGDAAGAIIFTPLLVLWYTDRQWSWTRWRAIESALLLGSLVLVGGVRSFIRSSRLTPSPFCACHRSFGRGCGSRRETWLLPSLCWRSSPLSRRRRDMGPSSCRVPTTRCSCCRATWPSLQ